MILEYNITDNRLTKVNPIDYPTHLQDNIVLKFNDKDGLINDKSYVFIKTHDNIKKVRIIKNGDVCACELPPFVTHNTFFKLKVLSLQGRHQMITNEVIVPIRVSDYLDYERTLAHVLPKPKGAIDDDALYTASSDWDIASDGITESELNTILTDRLNKELGGLDEKVDEKLDDRFDNKLGEWDDKLDDKVDDKVGEKLDDKADREHEHVHTDVTDWDDEIEEDFDLFLLNMTNKIREI